MQIKKLFFFIVAIVFAMPTIARVCGDDALSYQNLNAFVSITDEFLVIGARGGFQPTVFYRTQQSGDETRYLYIKKEDEEDEGHLMWALHSTKNGKLDRVYLDENYKFIMGPSNNSSLKTNFLHAPALEFNPKNLYVRNMPILQGPRYLESVVAPISVFDIVAKDLCQIREQFKDLNDVNEIRFILQLKGKKKDFIRKLKTFKPLFQMAKDAGYSYIELITIDENGDMQYSSKEMYDAVGVKMPSKEDLECRKALVRGMTKLSIPASKMSKKGPYEFLRNEKFADKVLKDIAGLQITGKTALSKNNPGSVKDKDGNTYKTVKIGDQVWMAENLKVKTDDGSCCHPENCEKYGRLYSWAAAMDLESKYNNEKAGELIKDKHRGICPEGWHLPNDDEWNTLFSAVGGTSTAGTKLKSTSGWSNGGNGTDSYGFSVLPAGGVGIDGDYDDAGYYARFWSSSEVDSIDAYYWFFDYDYGGVDQYDVNKDHWFSVRCIKDSL